MSATESMRKTPSETEIATTLSTLKLSTTIPQKPLHKPKSKPVADSWDLESSGSDTETEVDQHAGSSPAPLSTTSTSSSITTAGTSVTDDLPPHPPPPTPASPTPFDFPDNSPYGAGAGAGRFEQKIEKGYLQKVDSSGGFEYYN
ncbi:hypothetical protein E8E13_003484 [Curvularia kusanoi]|uniref:Uncharacterized protein n=1 Tax=Curvularia kusanoi TaxID=90978 RepID=A0A9P4WBU7_CURKU|nr:hypothetical protein E8E13_003484 [Curvularia kusanoi]